MSQWVETPLLGGSAYPFKQRSRALGSQSTLRIEREVNTPFSESRYYSYAQTQTEEHMRLLREFESAAS